MSTESVTSVPRHDAPYRGVSPWACGIKHHLQQSRRAVLATLDCGCVSVEAQQGDHSLWLVVRWPSGGGIALRTAFSPEGPLELESWASDSRSITCVASAPVGRFLVRLEIPDRRKSLLHFTVSIKPDVPLSMPFWPSDLYAIDADGDPIGTAGTVHAAQRGVAMGFLYASLTSPESGSFLYFQDLTSISDYCERVHSVPETRVGGSWPELGWTPPLSEREPLEAGTEIVISDAWVIFSPSIPDQTADLAQLFFDMLAEIYLRIDKREPAYQDWPAMAEETVRDLEHPDCITTLDGQRYLNAYVGTGDRRPESLVQLAVALPLLEYEGWRGQKIPLIDELRKSLPSFFDEEIGCIMRYPKSVAHQEAEDVDEKSAYEVDSWYLYHPLANLARLALHGYKDAKQLLLKSIDYAIAAAHHFDYRWPVIFDAKTFEVVREAPVRELGETDVAGLYAYLMLQMRDLTGDAVYLEEATRAVEELKGLDFNVGYQFNNTAWAANALMRLWRETGRDDYVRLSYMCLASVMQNSFIWDCRFGFATIYSMFFCVTPLREGAYAAAYEEMEMFASFHEYLTLAEGGESPSVRLLLSEFCKYATRNRIYSFPKMLPREAIADEPRNGHINFDLAMPLEDLYVGWDQAGQVGQEVYGAGVAPAFAVRTTHPVEGTQFLLFCQYPVYDLCEDSESKTCTFNTRGCPELSCLIRLIPRQNTRLPDVKVSLDESGDELRGNATGEGHREFTIPGGTKIRLTWL